MRDARLEEILALTQDKVALERETSYVTAGVLSYGRGLFKRPAVKGSETRYHSYFRLKKDQFVYSKLFAWEGALAVVPSAFDGLFVSQEFPTFNIDESKAVPAFISLLCRWEPFWSTVREGETGMGGRRKRVHPSRLLQATIPLPTLAEQRRMVDLIGMVDRVEAAVTDMITDTVVAYTALIRDAEQKANSSMPLSTFLIKERAGGTPSRKDPANFDGYIPWLKSGEVDKDRISVTQETISWTGLANSSAWIMPAGAIVVAMYGQGATSGSVGFTAIPMASNQAVLGLVPDEAMANPRFLYHWLRGHKEVMRARRVGSTQPNLSKDIVLAEQVPVLPRPTQDELAKDLDALSEVVSEASAMRSSAVNLRSSLLTNLLSGDHRIPDSYDSLLENAG